jgi:hypothetical protein
MSAFGVTSRCLTSKRLFSRSKTLLLVEVTQTADIFRLGGLHDSLGCALTARARADSECPARTQTGLRARSFVKLIESSTRQGARSWCQLFFELFRVENRVQGSKLVVDLAASLRSGCPRSYFGGCCHSQGSTQSCALTARAPLTLRRAPSRPSRAPCARVWRPPCPRVPAWRAK